MQKIKGEDQSRLFYESQAAAVDRIEEIQKSEGIDCDFRRLDGYLFQGDDMPADVIDEELDAVRAAGASVERLVGVPLSGCDSRHALRYPRQATFHPLKYLAGVADACVKRGVRFFADTAADEIVEENGAVTVKTTRGLIRAGHAVVATNASIVDRVALHSKTSPYRTYVIGFAIDRGALPDALYWDTEEPYHYVRLQPGDEGMDFVLVGGEDHKTGQANDGNERFARLEQWTRERFPQMGEVEYRWSGQVMEPVDGLAFIGRNPLDDDNVYIATGDSGQGMTHGTIAGMLLTDLIVGRPNPWTAVYDPARKPVMGVVNFINFTFSALLGPVFGWLLQKVAGGKTFGLDDYQTAFSPLLIGVGIAIVLTVILKETGPGKSPGVEAEA